MIGTANPNLPACERCGDIVHEEEMSVDHPGHCLVCAGKIDRECDPRRNDLARCEGCGSEERVQHLSVIHPTCCVWCAKKRIAAELSAAGMAAE